MSSNNPFILKVLSVRFGHSDDESNWAGTPGLQQPLGRWLAGIEQQLSFLERPPPSLLCSVQPRYSLSWSTITRLEAAS